MAGLSWLKNLGNVPFWKRNLWTKPVLLKTVLFRRKCRRIYSVILSKFHHRRIQYVINISEANQRFNRYPVVYHDI